MLDGLWDMLGVTPSVTPTVTPTVAPTVDITLITNTTAAGVKVIVGGLSEAIGAIVSTAQNGWLLFLVLLGLVWVFVRWALRLFHMRGR